MRYIRIFSHFIIESRTFLSPIALFSASAAPACVLCFAPVFLISRYRAENAAYCRFRISHFPSYIISKKAHISTFYKNTKSFSHFHFSLTDCIFTVFYRLLLPFSAYADRLYRSNYRFLLNSMKYKKLEEKPRPRDYNRIIKRKPNANGERTAKGGINMLFTIFSVVVILASMAFTQTVLYK